MTQRTDGARRLLGAGSWAVLDQATFAGANFLLNVLLARWLGAAEYGVFGVAFAVFLLLGTAHTALVTEPLLVFGAGRRATRFRGYLRRVLIGQTALTAAASIALLATAAVSAAVGQAGLAISFTTLAWVSPFVFTQWTLRRACYVDGRPRLAALGGGVYLVLVVAGAFAVRAGGWLDARSALALMALGSAGAAVLLAWRLVRTLPADGAPSDGPLPASGPVPADGASPADDALVGTSRDRIGADLRAHWTYGRWALGATFLAWLAGDVHYLVLAGVHGFAATGELRAAVNLIMPAVQTFSALGTVALPVLVRSRVEGAFRKRALGLLAVLVALGAGYGVVVGFGGGALLSLVYAGGYDGGRVLLVVLAVVPVTYAAHTALAAALRALERPRAVFVANVAAAVVAATVGVGLTVVFGAPGAAAAMVATGIVTAGTLAWSARTLVRSA